MNRFPLLVLIGLAACTGRKENAGVEIRTDSLKTEIKATAVVIQKQSEPDTLKGSLNATASGKIGNVEVNISYHSPAVRGRIIWGGLVAFDKVWVTGAHSATTIEFSKNVLIGGATVSAGKYALFTIPGKEEWVMIINKNWQQHLADDYDEKLDVVRVKVKPEHEETHQERLRYKIEDEGSGNGEIVMYWEKLEVSLEFKAK